jgi:hypothetical protein
VGGRVGGSVEAAQHLVCGEDDGDGQPNGDPDGAGGIPSQEGDDGAVDHADAHHGEVGVPPPAPAEACRCRSAALSVSAFCLVRVWGEHRLGERQKLMEVNQRATAMTAMPQASLSPPTAAT